VHPQTTQIVLQEEATSANVLIGYVSVKVPRPTTVTSLDVEFCGKQKLDWRQGEGPSAAMHTLRRSCVDISHRLLDCSNSNAVATAAAAKLLGCNNNNTYLRSSTSSSSRSSSDSFHTVMAHSGEYSPPSISRQSSACDTLTGGGGSASTPTTASTIVLEGEYRFPFEFVVPESLPASVSSPLGGVAFTLSATMRRSWYQAAVTSQAVAIDIVRTPRSCMPPHMPAPADENAPAASSLLLGFPSLSALTLAPLLFQAPVGSWDVSVYTPSRALFLGTDTRFHVFATNREAANCGTSEEEKVIELVELNITLSERISHCVPHTTSNNARRVTQQVAVACSLDDNDNNSSDTKSETGDHHRLVRRVLRHQQFNPQTIHALGDSFAELLPPAGTLRFALPRLAAASGGGGSKLGGRGAQPSSSSPLFSVAHELRCSVVVRIPGDDKECRLNFSAPALVLPETLANSHGAPSPLPCYASISNDIILAATSVTAVASSHHPPDYNTLYI
ncbi:hypothetical protein IWW47_002176, partial [Coemansia sp. RSA 2052]